MSKLIMAKDTSKTSSTTFVIEEERLLKDEKGMYFIEKWNGIMTEHRLSYDLREVYEVHRYSYDGKDFIIYMHDNGFRYSAGLANTNEITVMMYDCPTDFFVEELYDSLNKVIPINQIREDILADKFYK